MTSMIEMVARAIGGEENGAPVDEPGERWRNWESAARAAIAAMREPTEGMRVAGIDEAADMAAWGVDRPSLRIYTRMIDAALEEKP